MTISQHIAASREVAEALSYWATAAGILVAISGGLFAVIHTSRERKMAQWLSARERYAEYLRDSISHPHFFCDYWARNDLSEQDRWSYRQFISFMIWAIEDLLMWDKRQNWRHALVVDLAPHKTYLQSDDFAYEKASLFKPVQDLIDEVCQSKGHKVHA